MSTVQPFDLSDPHAGQHAGQPLLTAGSPLAQAAGALILVHGRGAPAAGMLSLFTSLNLPSLAALAPQAADQTWYPLSFLAPLEANEPFLGSALRRLESLVADLLARGLASERIAFLGFSQGACLALEFAARHPRRYAGVIGLSGGLIGPPGTPRDYLGSLAGTPVFLGASDPDPHVPFERVRQTETVLARMGAATELRRYPGASHAINDDELKTARALLQTAISHPIPHSAFHIPHFAKELPMTPAISGIHHITAITADAQKNIDFYTGVLGLRLVKLTVNFDDPGSYHLYYGDELGRPGSVVTFFAWPGASRGRTGLPQVTRVAYAIPPGASDYWTERLQSHNIQARQDEVRFGERVLAFEDPDGIGLELIPTAHAAAAPAGGPISPAHAIRAFRGVTLAEEGYERTAKLLTEVMGFQAVGSEGDRFRYRAADDGAVIDLLCAPDARRGGMGAGVVHHIAWRTPDDARQSAWLGQLTHLGYNVSPVMDRVYFHSIYYREPGGVLFEIATDTPGFAIDEAPDRLGTHLSLPPWLEPARAALLKELPPLRLPEWQLQARAA